MKGFVVIIDTTKMSVKLSASDDAVNLITSEEELRTFLKSFRVTHGILDDKIIEAFSELAELEERKIYTIAEGKKPKIGQNGRLDFKVDVSGNSVYIPPTDISDNERVDYKVAMSISVVSSGDLICNIIPPTVGVNGHNVEGKSLFASDGKEVSFTLGDGVEFDSDKSKVFATKEGRPVFLDKKLSISPLYEVQGDVNFNTGNITFKGHVFISGMVEDDFFVEAGSVEIRGSVGNSSIISDGDLIIGGGVNGHGIGHIKCKGDATVKYLNDSKIEVEGDLTVLKDIVNSEVKCNGSVKASRIVGGATSAFKGIEVNVAGSEMGTPTILETGVNYHIKEVDKALVSLSKRIETIITPFINHLGEQEYFRKVTPKVKQRILDSYNEFYRVIKSYLQLIKAKSILRRKENSSPVFEVMINKMLYADVSVSTLLYQKEFISEFSGPIKIVENPKYSSLEIENSDNNKDCESQDNSPTEPPEPSESPEPPEPSSRPQKVIGSIEKVMIDNLIKVIYSKVGIHELYNKFKFMIQEQDFDVCVYADKYANKRILIEIFRKARIENIFDAKDIFHAVKMGINHEKEKLVFICNFHVGIEDGVRIIANFLQNSEDNFGIILVKSISKNLAAFVAKRDSIAVFKETVDKEVIIKQIRDFGLHF